MAPPPQCSNIIKLHESGASREVIKVGQLAGTTTTTMATAVQPLEQARPTNSRVRVPIVFVRCNGYERARAAAAAQ